MIMKPHIIDTNILIYYFNGSLPLDVKDRVEQIFEASFNISIITKIEFLGWRKHTMESYEQAEHFLNYAYVIGLTNEIADCAIKLRRMTNIKTPDALIAATAIQLDAVLITRNTGDFKNIENIDIINPFLKPADE